MAKVEPVTPIKTDNLSTASKTLSFSLSITKTCSVKGVFFEVVILQKSSVAISAVYYCPFQSCNTFP